MTDLATTYGSEQNTGASPTPSPTPTQPQPQTAPTTLITAEQVRFSTAAAVALPPAKTRGFVDVMHEVLAKVRAAFASSDVPPARRHYPSRYDFLEQSRMAREMDRL